MTQCSNCDEWLPHSCAPIVTIARVKGTGKRIITIHDREVTPAK